MNSYNITFLSIIWKAPSFKAASKIIFKGNENDSPHIFIVFIEILSHPWDLLGSSNLIIARMSFSVILNEFRRAFFCELMSGNTLDLDAGVHWEAKNELNRLAFSLKSYITLPLWKIRGILGIFLLLRNQLRTDQ